MFYSLFTFQKTGVILLICLICYLSLWVLVHLGQPAILWQWMLERGWRPILSQSQHQQIRERGGEKFESHRILIDNSCLLHSSHPLIRGLSWSPWGEAVLEGTASWIIIHSPGVQRVEDGWSVTICFQNLFTTAGFVHCPEIFLSMITAIATDTGDTESESGNECLKTK